MYGSATAKTALNTTKPEEPTNEYDSKCAHTGTPFAYVLLWPQLPLLHTMTNIAYGLHIICPESLLVVPNGELVPAELELEVWNGVLIIIIVIGILNRFEEKVRLRGIQVSRQPLLGRSKRAENGVPARASKRTSRIPSLVCPSVRRPDHHEVVHSHCRRGRGSCKSSE